MSEDSLTAKRRRILCKNENWETVVWKYQRSASDAWAGPDPGQPLQRGRTEDGQPLIGDLALKWIRVQLAIAVGLALFGSTVMNAQTNKDRPLDARQQNIVMISALTATGDLEHLRTALNSGLDGGLTINEIKDVLVQMYAYCGFPRSLNGINTFMTVLQERKQRGVSDVEGKTATPMANSGDKYERGRKTLETLTRQPQSKPAKGFGEFSPAIDRYLKEHLFADIFDSDVLSHQQRELATISALAAMTGVEPQLESHISMGMNTGLNELELKQAFDLIEKSVSKEQAETARRALAKVAGARRKNQ